MNSEPQVHTSNIIAHVFRLKPGDDLYQSLKTYVNTHKISSAFIMTCVGSLQKINIRLAEATDYLINEAHYEITSLVGCLSCNDRIHLHITLSDKNGTCYGGHLSSEGNIIFTTAEIVLGELPQLVFTKEKDEISGWDELKVLSK